MANDHSSEKGYSSVNYRFENIMNEDTFTTEIKDYLKLEGQCLQEILDVCDYTTVIEIGCGKGINSCLFADKDIQYIGIDVNRRHILEAEEFASQNDLKNATFKTMSLYDIANLEIGKESKVLVYLPFNIFGNIEEPERFIEIVNELEWDVIMFTYQINALAIEERNKYYTNCGFDIKYHDDGRYTCFCSGDGFSSKVYRYPQMEDLLKPMTSNSYLIENWTLGKIGDVYFFEKI